VIPPLQHRLFPLSYRNKTRAIQGPAADTNGGRLETGNTYERSSIERWLRIHNTDPLTNVVMSTTSLRPNVALRQHIEAMREEGRRP
jgi:hypothetical protein